MRGIWIGAAAIVVAVAIALSILFWEGGGSKREAQAPQTQITTQTTPGKATVDAGRGLQAPSDVAAPERSSGDSASGGESASPSKSRTVETKSAPGQIVASDTAVKEVEQTSPTTAGGSTTAKLSPRTLEQGAEAQQGAAVESTIAAGKQLAGQAERKSTEAGQKLSALQPRSPDKTAGSTVPALSPDTVPSFDVVRISQQCTAVIAGRSHPGAVVTVWDGDQPLGQVSADGNGEWVLVVDKPMRSGSRQLSLIAEMPGQEPVQSASVVVVVVPDCAKPAPEPEQAIAVLTPREGGASKILQPPPPKGDTSEAKGLSLDSVDYDDKGEVVLSGRAEPGTSVRAYVNNQPVGETKTSSEGDWQVKPSQPVDPGVHKLRIDQVARQGKVEARVELPFSRADPTQIVIAAGHVVVQPGNSLWRIARRTYGEGLKFTVIYQANRQNIADPDLIYPGQIFTLPQVN